MKIISLFAILLFNLTISITIAQTNVPGGYVSGTWTHTGSPYLIQGSIRIASDSTLNILPGVVVNFQGAYKLLVQGRLLAIGNSNDIITFTSSDTTVGWRGIRFDNTSITSDSSKIIYCKLQYGKALGPSPANCGGALYFNNFSKTIISHCNILNCAAQYAGAGIFCNNSSPIITFNYILNSDSMGGPTDPSNGIYCNDNSNPNISNNIISNNPGGGIFSASSNPIINNNTITFNSGYGGIRCSNSNTNISFNTVSNNKLGGITVIGGSSNITYNTITYNISFPYAAGGGIVCGSNNTTISKNIICNNSAARGGGIYCYANPNISDNVICNNTANEGGGIYTDDNGSPTITNATISNNQAINGGALYCHDNSSPIFRNCILYGNNSDVSGPQVFLYYESSAPGFYYSNIQGGLTAFELNDNFFNGIYQNNINTDPLFIAPSSGSGCYTVFDGLTADWSLDSVSPCVNTGDPNGTYSSTDLAGNPRISNFRIDMGAYEYQGSSIIEETLQDLFSVYPNPTSNILHIECEQFLLSDRLNIIVSDMQGRILLSQNIINSKTEINISSLVTGIYFIKLIRNDKTIVTKFVKE